MADEMKTVRVLHVLGAMDFGGVQMRLLDIVGPLKSRAIEIDVLALAGRRGILADQLEAAGGTVIPMSIGAAFPGKLLRLLGSGEYTAVHSHVATTSGPILALAKIARVPVRIAHSRSDYDGQGEGLRRRLQKSAFRRMVRASATSICGVTGDNFAFLYGPGWESDPRCHILPDPIAPARLDEASGTDLRAELGLLPGQILLICVGRYDPAKNWERLPRLVAACCEAGLDAVCVAVGQIAPHEIELVGRASALLGVGGRIRFLGPRADAVGLVAQADVMLLPSRWEGLPGVVLESLGVGTPVVSSDVSGSRFIAERLGPIDVLSLATADSDWAHAVNKMLQFDRSNEVRMLARRNIQESEFGLNAVVSNYADLYRLPNNR
jgi:glycosyltransferase involved in cell wall biosynthesis